MKHNLKYWLLAAALAVGVSAAPFDDQAKDYSKTKQYQQGIREGQDDHAHNKDHSKKRHFKKDEDQKAYEAGYQKGFVVQVKL
jgi:coproporphyrinogen III oxidase-like Fe-S oxidoreductase